MTLSMMYHDGNRRLQDRFDSRRISDRLEEKLTRREFTADDKTFIEGASYFFLATADAQGRPDCSYKGGMPGFVRVAGPKELAFPDYDGNGMFKSLGNILVNPSVGMLFIAMHGKPQRLRVNGEHQGYSRAPTGSEGLGFCPCEGALYLLANGSAAFRRYSMKSCAAGLKARFFSVVMLVVPRAMASSTGKTLSWESVAPKWSADS
jgi:Pyridoxamine 5'-phosphate oxidase